MRSIYGGFLTLALTIGTEAFAADAQQATPPMGGVPPINQSSILTDEEQPSKAAPEAKKPGDIQETPPVAENPVPREPLVVIRFNQHHVYYDRAVAQAVAKARAIKPLAVFDVVSFEPDSATASRSSQDRVNGQAAANIQGVVRTLQSQGVSPSEVTTRRETSSNVASQEVHIFVR